MGKKKIKFFETIMCSLMDVKDNEKVEKNQVNGLLKKVKIVCKLIKGLVSGRYGYANGKF